MKTNRFELSIMKTRFEFSITKSRRFKGFVSEMVRMLGVGNNNSVRESKQWRQNENRLDGRNKSFSSVCLFTEKRFLSKGALELKLLFPKPLIRIDGLQISF